MHSHLWTIVVLFTIVLFKNLHANDHSWETPVDKLAIDTLLRLLKGFEVRFASVHGEQPWCFVSVQNIQSPRQGNLGFASNAWKKVKKYPPKWWFNRDLPWQKVKNHLELNPCNERQSLQNCLGAPKWMALLHINKKANRCQVMCNNQMIQQCWHVQYYLLQYLLCTIKHRHTVRGFCTCPNYSLAIPTQTKVAPKKAIRIDKGIPLLNHWRCSICSTVGECTPPKTTMEPQNLGLEDDLPFQRGHFQVPCCFSWVYMLNPLAFQATTEYQRPGQVTVASPANVRLIWPEVMGASRRSTVGWRLLYTKNVHY